VRGDKHMATKRGHNKVRLSLTNAKRRIGRIPTETREATLHAIGNRGPVKSKP
jgi:hypothetical protein